MAGRRSGEARQASISDAAAYLAKAHEFLRASQDSLELSNMIAAVGNAVHAAISAADAIAAARSGSVCKGEHTQAAGHLEKAAAIEGREAGRHLRRLLPLKSRAEYDPHPFTHAEASAAVRAAQRIVRIAERVLASTET